jgi:hypothetical protein
MDFLKLYFNTWQLTTIALVLNAYSLLSLMRGNFVVFLLLLLTTLFVLKVPTKNNKCYELKYKNITEWFIMFSVVYIYYTMYGSKITGYDITLFYIILLLHNINFSIRNTLVYKNLPTNTNQQLQKTINKWITPYKSETKTKLENIYKYTNTYFNENITIMYLVILSLYIYNK